MNKLLARQIKKYFKGVQRTPEMETLFKVIGNAYDDFESDRKLIERSFNLSSQELQDEIENRKKTEEKLHRKIEELEQLNRLIVNRELKMIQLKKEIKKLKKE